MSEPQWTPGPLWVDPEEPRDIMAGKPECCDLVATTYPITGKHGAAQANALLYVAAPDLYTALEAAEEHLAEELENPALHPIHHCPVLDMVRAALAKARGEL